MPAKAGIQKYQMVTKALDPGFRRGDDFLRVHQVEAGPAGDAPGQGDTGTGSLRGMTWTDVALKEAITLLPSYRARLSTDWRVT